MAIELRVLSDHYFSLITVIYWDYWTYILEYVQWLLFTQALRALGAPTLTRLVVRDQLYPDFGCVDKTRVVRVKNRSFQ